MIKILVILSVLLTSCNFSLQVYEEPKAIINQSKNTIVDLVLESTSPKKITKRFETLLINADSEFAQMYFTNDSSCSTGGNWEPVVVKKENWEFNLPESSQPVNVYVKFKKNNGDETDCQVYTFDFENVLTIGISSPVNGITSVGYKVYHGTCTAGTRISVESADIANLPEPVDCDGEFHIGIPFKSATSGIKNFMIVSTDVNGIRKSIPYTANYQPTGINSGTGFDKETMAGVIDSSTQKIYIVGGFKKYNGITHENIIRLNLDGTVDNSFTSLAFNSNAWIYDVALDEINQKIYVAGIFSTYGGAAAVNLLRLNADGSKDNTFTPTAPNNSLDTVVLDIANSKIYIGGGFTNYAGTGNNSIARLNIGNGSVDNTFLTTGTGFDSSVYSITIDSALSKIWVTGAFSKYNNILQTEIALLNTNGTLDTSFFSELSDYGNARSLIKIPSLNQVWIASEWGYYNNSSMANIASFNLTGSKVTPWTANWNLDGACFDLKHDAVKNHVYAVGMFSGLGDENTTIYNSSNVIKVNLDGSPVKRFQTGKGADSSFGWAGRMVMDYTNQQIFLLGEAYDYNWETRNGLIVIDMDDASLK
jgi:hypothetical protein